MNDVSDLTKYECDWGAISSSQYYSVMSIPMDAEFAEKNLEKADLSGANLTGEPR